MHTTPKKVIHMTMFLFVFLTILSCAKDSDLLLDAVLNETEVSIEGQIDNEAEEVLDNNMVTRTFRFSPTNDAYVQDTHGINQSIIRLQADFRTSYLMFDLSAIKGSITDAVLQFSIDSDEGDGSIAIHKGATANWTEENLTVDNAPEIEAQLGSMNKSYKVGDPEKVALNISDLNAEITTIIMTQGTGNDLAFASKEHPTNEGPHLIITYQTAADEPLIEQDEPSNEEQTAEEEVIQPNNNTTASTEGAYYVSTTGNSSNNGLTEATAWNIEHAFSNAIAGDVVYIKAGNYGNKELVVDNTGSLNNPIKFIGYTNTPGDLVSIEGSTFKYGDQLSASKMPLLEGTPINGIGSGTAITIYEPHIFIENIQLTKFEKGIFAKTNNGHFKNIVVTQMGDFNPSHSYPNGTSNAFLNYSGIGILMDGDSFDISNNFVLNCGAQAITFQNTNNSKGDFNAVYADNNVNPTDYYFHLGSNTTNSEFTNTTVFRVGSLTHLGHGIVLKGANNITGNTFDGFEITNTVLEPQFPNTSNNVFKNGKITKESNVNSQTPSVGGINLANGAHHNYFESITLTNCSIKFQDWKDGLSGDVDDASDNNLFKNVTVKDSYSAIAFAYFQVENHASSADNNVFEDCRFENLEYLFEVDRANSNTKLKNCTIINVNKFKIERISGGPSYPINSTYENCNWSNINFTPPN